MNTLRTLLLAALLLSCGMTASAQKFEVDGICYNITDAAGKNVEVTYRGENTYDNEYTGEIIIPATVTYNGTVYNVTGIGNNGLYHCDRVTKVTIPNSVTTIGSSAFYGCVGLKEITVPGSVKKIGYDAFNYCRNLETMSVERTNTVYDSRNNCNAIIETSTNTLVSGCRNSVIPEGIRVIGYRAFYNCTTLKSITIPNSVTDIGSYAFCSCDSLRSIVIPSSVTYIANQAFGSSDNLESIIVENGNTVYDSRNNCNAIIKTSSGTLITGCKTTVIPGNVTRIESHAFSGSYGLKSITIPGSVKSIGYGAFMSCVDLEEIKLSNGLAEIETEAFCDCRKFTNITIPASVTKIAGNAFSHCSSHTCIVVDENNTVYDSREGCNAVIETATNTLAVACNNSRIPNSVSSIGEGAFYGRGGLESIVIPESVTSIGEKAFYNNNGIRNITIPGSVKTIGKNAFSYCHNLKSVISLGTTAPELGDKAFYGIETETLYYPSGSNYSNWANYFKKMEEIYPDKENRLELSSIMMRPGGKATLSLYLKNNTDITGYQCDLYLPEKLRIAVDAEGNELIGLSPERTTERDHSLQFSRQADGSIRIVSYSTSNTPFEGNEGEVLRITLEIPQYTSDAEYIVELRDIELTDKHERTYTVPLAVSTVTVKSVTAGDINEDGRFSITDVQGIVNLILASATPEMNPAADLNNDNKITIMDLQAMVNKVLNISKGATANRAKEKREKQTTGENNIYIEPFSINAGETKEISVMLDNPNDMFSSLQFDLYLPEGIEVVCDESGYCLGLGSRTSSCKHNYPLAAMQKNGALRILCYSDRGHVFNDESGDIITMTIKADENVTGGTYELSIRNAELARTDESGDTPADTVTEVTVNNTTEIEPVTTGKEMQNAIFDLQGRRVEKITTPGIYIINGRKQMIK